MVQCIAEHSVDLSLLPEQAVILDAGCRGFEFTNYFRELGHNVLAIDIDTLEGDYQRVGIGFSPGKACVTEDFDPQARRLTQIKEGMQQVDVLTLQQLEDFYGKFDLIKFDVEGEEQAILKTVTHPIARQVSVEFHAHCTLQTKESLDDLLGWLSQWYTIHNQVWESRHGAGFNYWDVLLISK